MNNEQSVIWCDRQDFYGEAASHIKSVSSVLDIGCGIRPQQYFTPDLLVCVEPHLEYVEILKTSLKDSNAVIIPLDAKTALAGMPDRSVDSIFLIDVIEHMDKENGVQVLVECERVARQQVVIFTPLGFMPQELHAGDVDGWNLHGGEWQDHKSGWYPEDFSGWDVIACKHLHLQDYLGQDITPPYGGFYAVKNISKVANLLNDVYSNDVISTQTSNMPWLNEMFPLFGEKVISLDIIKSNLKCGIRSCQRTTELFIELGATESQDVIFAKAAQEKAEEKLREARQHNERIKEFAEQFSKLNGFAFSAAMFEVKSAELDVRVNEISTMEAELNSRLSVRETELNSRWSVIAERELELSKRAAELNALEQGIVDSLCGKVSRKIRGFFK